MPPKTIEVVQTQLATDEDWEKVGGDNAETGFLHSLHCLDVGTASPREEARWQLWGPPELTRDSDFAHTGLSSRCTLIGAVRARVACAPATGPWGAALPDEPRAAFAGGAAAELQLLCCTQALAMR